VVAVAMGEHCHLEHGFMRVRNVEVRFFFISTLIHDMAITKTEVLQDYKGIYGSRYL